MLGCEAVTTVLGFDVVVDTDGLFLSCSDDDITCKRGRGVCWSLRDAKCHLGSKHSTDSVFLCLFMILLTTALTLKFDEGRRVLVFSFQREPDSLSVNNKPWNDRDSPLKHKISLHTARWSVSQIYSQLPPCRVTRFLPLKLSFMDVAAPVFQRFSRAANRLQTLPGWVELKWRHGRASFLFPHAPFLKRFWFWITFKFFKNFNFSYNLFSI